MDFVRRTIFTKTGILGTVLVIVGLVGFIPALGLGFNVEAITAGLALLFLRDSISKQTIRHLDPVLDKTFGDATSEQIQEFLIAIFVAEGMEPQEATEKAIEVTKKLNK